MDPDINDVYIPKKSSKVLHPPPSNKQILDRHKKASSSATTNEVKTIQIRQVDVEKMIEKLPPPAVVEPASPTEDDTTLIDLPETISVPKLKKIKKIVEVPPALAATAAPTSDDVAATDEIKKGILEQNGDGYYINDEEDLEKIDGFGKNLELFTLLFELSNRIYHEMGSGHTESIYQKALTIELINHDIYHEKEKRVLITYQDKKHGRVYSLGEERVDVFLLDYNLIIELKAVNNIPREQELAQIRKYYRELLKAGTILDKWGLIINFPQPGPTKKAKNTIDFVLVNL